MNDKMRVASLGELLEIPLWELAGRALRPVRVAVLDTGLDAAHEALRGRVCRASAWEPAGSAPPVCRALSPKKNNDLSGHGTAVASIVAALAPNAVIEDIRVLEPRNAGFGEVVLAGLEAAIRGDAEIVNVSIAFAKDRHWPATAALLEEAQLRGKIVVASKRNFPRPDDLGLPAELAGAVSVDAGAFPNPWILEHFRGAKIAFGARGNAVPGAQAGGGWARFAGASFAAPVVAAFCALWRGANPGLEPFELKTLLKHHAATAGAAAGKSAPDPLEDAASAALYLNARVPWVCSSCGSAADIPDNLRRVRCPRCGGQADRRPLLEPAVFSRYLEALRKRVPPRFSFHNARHAREVVEAVYAILARLPRMADARRRELLFAALLHDWAFSDDPERHEELSADFAAGEAVRNGFSAAAAGRIGALVRATRPECRPSGLAERVIRDADLFHVGTPAYPARAVALRNERLMCGPPGGAFSESGWIRDEIAFLERQRFSQAWLEKERCALRAAHADMLRKSLPGDGR